MSTLAMIDSTTAEVAATEPQTPSGRDAVIALGGLLALGSAAVIGGGPAALGSAPVALATQAGGLLLTAPALLVLHQLLGLQARPDALVRALGRTLVRAGDLGLGLTPAMLFLAATTRCAGLLLAGLLAMISLTTLAGAWRELVDAERSVREASAWPMEVLALCWCWLNLAVALRLAIATFPALLS